MDVAERTQATELRAKASRLKVEHQAIPAPGSLRCWSCDTKWPCDTWETAEGLEHAAYRLEHPR